jgi:iron complex outermembrane receptor protein
MTTAILMASFCQAMASEPTDTTNISKNISLDEIVISATKVGKTTPVAYSEMSKQQLQKLNNGQGIPSLIIQTPSVVMTSDDGLGIGYAGFRIRGTDASRINVTVNGVPMNDSESHTVFWVNMPDFASSVNSIQIQRGAGTSTNGGAAFGATVAMETNKPAMQPDAFYSISAGSFGTMKNTISMSTGLLKNNLAFDARYSNVRSDGFRDRAAVRMQSYFGSATYYGTNTLLKFQAFGSSEKTYQAWNGTPSDSIAAGNRSYNSCGSYWEDGVEKFYKNQTDNYWQYHYHLMLSQQLNDYWNLNATLHYTNGKGYYEDYKANAKYSSYKLSNFVNSNGDTKKKTDLVRRKWLDNDFYGAVISTNYTKGNIHFTYGAAANRYDGDHFGRVIWAKTAEALPQPDYEYYRNNGDKWDYNTYAKATWQFLPFLSVYGDLQYRGIDYKIKGSDDKAGDNLDVSRHWDFFNPKAGITFNKGGNNAYASFSVAHREPTRDNFTEAGVDERPKHETLFDYEAGYNYTNSRFHAGANLYYMNYHDQLVLTGKISEIGETLTSNIDRSYRAGIEIMAGITPTEWFSWNANATFSRNKIKNFTQSVEIYDENWDFVKMEDTDLGTTDISFSPNIIANNSFDFTWKQFNASFTTQYVSRQYLDNSSSKRRSIDPYCVSNLRLGYTITPKFLKELSFDLTINNIFNAKYETSGWVWYAMVGGDYYQEDGLFTQAGTNVMGRMSIRF